MAKSKRTRKSSRRESNSPPAVPMPLPQTTQHATHARYETLLEVAESIAAHRQLSTLFADLSRCLNRLISFDFISLTLLDPKEHALRLHILQTDRPVVGMPAGAIPFDQTPTGIAL